MVHLTVEKCLVVHSFTSSKAVVLKVRTEFCSVCVVSTGDLSYADIFLSMVSAVFKA